MKTERSVRKTVKRSVRDKIVSAATERFHALGYGACGVQEIVDAAGVPKGSFYNYFKAKELLAREILENYWAGAQLEGLADKSIAPMERLRRHFEHVASRYKNFGFEKGCLVTKFVNEVSDSTPLLQKDLRGQVARWTALIADTIREGQTDGSISKGADPGVAARFLVEGWAGMTGAMKLTASRVPIEEFLSVAFGMLLQPGAQTTKAYKRRS